ncbi:HDOD domain-containing protein [Rhodoferax sp.]|uniref:HDOD domain-containing protein n=1 Tax=Rhodoferax sp. TaxID=50421 RepID=UPI002629846D|nr:HDOD domain-containing protein [Rhodoferax sp.]MDD5480703.1 HDOD domain-containing protein [Rhodoferax sp.]
MSHIDAFFATVKLPTISEVAQQLIKTLNDEDAGIQEVSAIIAKDPALSAKLLRLANSAQFGLPRGVATLDEAIHMVGMAKVRTLSLAACMNESFPALPGLNAHEFWRSSMACAGYAQWLAAAVDIDAQQAWLTGMMLRLGELLIGQANPQALVEIEKLPHVPGARWEREKQHVGFAETQITAELARRWNFPASMIKALEHALEPLEVSTFSKLAGVLHLAGILADVPDAKADAIDMLEANLLAKLGLDATWMKAKLPASDSFISIA